MKEKHLKTREIASPTSEHNGKPYKLSNTLIQLCSENWKKLFLPNWIGTSYISCFSKNQTPLNNNLKHSIKQRKATN